jgi:hypothetical protein
VVVAVLVFSKPPRISASAPLPDSLTQLLRRQRALAGGEVAEYLFAPGNSEDTTWLLVARHSVAVLTPRRVRSYPREGVRVHYGVDVRKGLGFRLVLSLPRARRDTVFRSLSLRDLYEVVRRLDKALPEDSVAGGLRLRLTPR